MISEKRMKPAEHAERQVLSAILNGEFPPGSALPGERVLAEQIGVTRPTLRETLQKMAREGWLNIRHGKSTLVRDYMTEGGVGVLSTLARFGEDLPMHFVEYFLMVRCVILPPVAKMTMINDPNALECFLAEAKDLDDTAEAFTDYDWQLQLLMAGRSGNPFFRIILNDFDFMYRKMGRDYFLSPEARSLSMDYYRDLFDDVRQRNVAGVETCVARVMEQALALWKAVVSS